MELRQLRYFVTVAEELHFGRAAHRMHIVQPAVSQQIRRLERELGVELFDRSPRHVRLTVAGERLLPEARRALAATDRMAALAGSLTCAHHSELRIGVGPGLSAGLEPGLARLRETSPELSVRLSGGPLPEQLEAARTGRLDLLVVRGEGDWPDVRTFDLWEEPVLVALPRRHPLAESGGVRLDQLADLALRLPAAPDELAFSDWIRQACRSAGFEPVLGRGVERLSEALVEIGNGEEAWTVLAGCADDPDAPACVALLPVRPELRVPVRMVVPSYRPASCVRELSCAFGRTPEAITRP